MKNPRFILLIALLVLIGIVGTIFYLTQPASRKKISQRPQQMENEIQGLTGPILRSERQLSGVPTVTPRPKENPEVVVSPPVENAPVKPTVIRVYTGKPAPPEPIPLGDYAPYGRLVKCELVNTVDSSTISTPIIGLVSEDVVWDGRVIIPRRSEVHGTAQVDQTRERIASQGPFTFVLNDPDDPGLGRELVVQGVALDREEDQDFKTYGITDGSAGLRGMVIKTDKLADVKLFIATFLSGISQGLQSTTTNIFGYVQPNPNGSTGSVPGYVINPASQGAQNVLNLYAQQILQAIQQDGFFIRVQAGKQFYVYVRQVINLNKTTVGGDSIRGRMEKEFLAERAQEEKMTEPRREENVTGPSNGLPVQTGLRNNIPPQAPSTYPQPSDKSEPGASPISTENPPS